MHALDPDGCIRDWLVSPPWSTPCEDLEEVLDPDGSPWGPEGRWVLTNGPDVAPLKSRLHARRPLVVEQDLPVVVEGGRVSWTAPGGDADEGEWTRFRAGEDGCLDWSRFCFAPEYRHAVAATVLEVDQAEWRTLEVASTGPVAVWVGQELVAHASDMSYMEPVAHRVRVRLPSGATPLVVATWQVAFRECRHIARVRVLGQPVRVVIPSPGADEHASAVAERILARVSVRSWAIPGGVADLQGPKGAALRVAVGEAAPRSVRLLDGTAELTLVPTPGEGDGTAAGDTTASMLGTGETVLTVGLDDPSCPVRRELRVSVLPPSHRLRPTAADPSVWREEVLAHVATAHPSSARALARTAREAAALVEAEDLAPALTMLTSRADCADFEAVGLMHLWHRVPPERWPEGLRESVRETLLGFKFWIDQPGLDAMCYFTENHQLVWHTAELLAGEAFRDEVFDNSGRRGAEHAAHGAEFGLEWMRRKLAGGFSEFDSNAYLAIDSLALVSLVELAEEAAVRQLAEALLDKVLLTLAANSWHGVHGAAHGRSYVPTLRSSRFEETGPVMWGLWGTGALNSAVLPATALCTARRYVLPPLVRAVAHADPDRWEGRQVYRGTYRDTHDLLARPYASDLRVWRTPEVMLSSVQDYRPGLPGLQEHVWGATLAPEVQVFVTHPANDNTTSSARPNAWAGQLVLPRARQHEDTVLVLHRAAQGGSLGTHLWFPAPLMDEVVRSGPWVAGRVGDGYVAVACAGGFAPVQAGAESRQSWLPRGDGQAFVATVSRRTADGSFAEFVSRLEDPEFHHGALPAVSWRTRDGCLLELDWEGPFTVDGACPDLDEHGCPECPPHLDNPACRVEFGDKRLDAAFGGHRLVLDLVTGVRVEPPSAEAVGPGGR